MKKFPSIDQFRQVIREVKSHHDFIGKDDNGDVIYKHTSAYPTLTFKGTVKLHGTNSGIVKYKDRIEFQSRERVLSLQQDNSGFMLAMSNKDLNFLFDGIEFNDHIAVFGEWCGSGIQSGVAISKLPKKMFVIFGYLVDDKWIDVRERFDNDQNIYHIDQFEHYVLNIDFEKPEIAQNELIKITEAVERCCPVGKYLGVEGIGEGVVWKAQWDDHFYQFKVKGEKHSISKVKTLAPIDVEMINNISEFVDNVLTEQRLMQGVTWLNENSKSLDQKSTGDYLRWVVNDVIKEESDTIVANQLDVKKINSIISNKARLWFFNYLDRLVMA